MPEAFAIALVAVISAVVYVVASLQARDPRFHQPALRKVELERERAWLEDRLLRAEREKWSAEMQEPIREQLESAIKKQARYAAK